MNPEVKKLEVIGYLGRMGSLKVPFFMHPVLAIVESEVVILLFRRDGDRIIIDETMSRKEFRELVEVGGATSLSSIPAQENHGLCVYGDKVVYQSNKESLQLIIAFSSGNRELGDIEFCRGKNSKAQEYYELTASASQEAKDYARLIICENMSVARMRRLRQWITIQLKDREELVDDFIDKVKREILAGE